MPKQKGFRGVRYANMFLTINCLSAKDRPKTAPRELNSLQLCDPAWCITFRPGHTASKAHHSLD